MTAATVDKGSFKLTRVAAQCRHKTYHIFEDVVYLEIVAPDTDRSRAHPPPTPSLATIVIVSCRENRASSQLA